MLADFQQALADLTASPALCRAVIADPAVLEARYALEPRERARLRAIVTHPGMAAACTVYRMNRLAPIAMNLGATLRALGPAARDALEAYWEAHPRGHAHFFVESDRFCRWLERWLATGPAAPPGAGAALAREAAAVRAALAATRPPAAPVSQDREAADLVSRGAPT